MSAVASANVVLIGAGGIGAPAAMALVAGGARRLTVVDDDTVEISNLHRQILFTAADVGRSKLDAFAGAVERLAPGTVVTRVPAKASNQKVLKRGARQRLLTRLSSAANRNKQINA